jgi:PKD domain/Secretion system C-terminal sorting domain
LLSEFWGAAYTTNIPTLYYENKATQRTNLVDGWGTVTTPYGTFTNALRMQTTLVENDTIALVGTGLPRTIRTSRELKWLDNSKKLPILVVTQIQNATVWTTTKVEFLDIQRDFQSTALFVYSPFLPAAGDVVNFQNLSSNASTYSWNFGDPTSTTNTSSLENPDHTYTANGTYTVSLTASNGTFTNTTTMIVIVSNILASSDFETVEKPKLYPNPFSKSITISDDYSYSQFDLYAIDGKKISTGISLNNVDFSYLTNGIYILQFTTEKGTESFRILKN